MSDPAVRQLVERSRKEQGLPATVEDATTIARIVLILVPVGASCQPLRRRRRRKDEAA